MSRARALAVAVLLLSYGAVGARQPAVRAAVPLPVPAGILATTAGLPSSDASMLLLHVVRLLFSAPDDPATADGRRRAAIRAVLWRPNDQAGDLVPLPLDPSIWRETILERPVPDRDLVAAIAGNRETALLYYGLAALDDQTLAWLGPDRETLQHLRSHAALFATFGRSIHVSAGRVSVPGGRAADRVWTALTGVEPERPAAFVQRIFRDDDGRLALLYDSVAHLDESRQRFALGLQLPAPSRDARLRALLEAFTGDDWQPSVRPFSRASLDASVLLSTLAVTATGEAAGPMTRGIWDRVFRDDDPGLLPFWSADTDDDVPHETDETPVDAAWLAARISRVPVPLGRRRLDTVLFAQRVFTDTADPVTVTTALRGFASFPALMLTLERIGATDAGLYADAARYAARLTAVVPAAARRTAIVEFQSAIGLVERARRAGALDGAAAAALVNSLLDAGVSPERGYESRLSAWLRTDLLRAIAPAAEDAADPAETAVLSALAGVRQTETPAAARTVEWEGAQYRVNPPDAELRRLRRIREQQGGLSLDAALAAARLAANLETGLAATRPARSGVKTGGPAVRPVRGGAERPRLERTEDALADTLESMLYAAYLGDAGAATDGNAALRHDLGLSTPATAWQLPYEEAGAKGASRIRGSLLGLESALGRFSLRHLGPSAPAPSSAAPVSKVSAAERQIVALTAALLNPWTASDAGRDEIAGALARGRARASALTADPTHLDKVVREAGLSEWRRQALAWTVERNPGAALAQFSSLELFWLGVPHPSAAEPLAAWGVAATPLTGCLCVQVPGRRDWETRSGRSSGAAAEAADMSLQVADALASLQLPASLAPAIFGFAAQDLLTRVRPAHADDAPELDHAGNGWSRERLIEYVAALTANGPLVRVEAISAKETANRNTRE